MQDADFNIRHEPPKYFFGVLALLFLVWALISLKEDLAFVNQGETATVEKLKLVSKRYNAVLALFGLEDMTGAVSYEATIAYTTRQGRLISTKISFGRAEMDLMNAGQLLQIQYLPDMPAKVRLAGAFAFSGLIPFLGSLLMSYLQYTHWRRLRRLEQETGCHA